MTWKHLIGTAFSGLRTNKSRSALTILGIVIGITAIMLVVSLGAGAQALILGEIEGLGTNTVAVVPGREPSGPSDSAQIFSDSLREKDLLALKSKFNVPNLKSIMPVLFGGDTGVYLNETYRLTIFGGSELMEEIFDARPEAGEFFSEDDVKSRADVVVIGSKVREELFGESNPIGEKIRIKGRNFKVIGYLAPTGGGSLFNFDEAAMIPYTTARDYIFGIKYYHRFIIQADDDKNVDIVAEDVRRTLRESHDIDDPSKDDFFVSTQADLAKRLSTITTSLTWFLIAMASISLFVGGIGIMNIMLVSVTERTREIGLRKALGATDRDILSQFLLEAVFLTAIGGMVGIILGTLFSYLISFGLSVGLNVDWKFVFPLTGIVLGLFVSSLVGLVFGGYPARKASRKSPIEALRYE
jgi:putative ABC transport system permease protein